MDDPRIATVQAIYQAFGRGDVPTILACMAQEVVWDHDTPSFGLPWYEPRRGPAELPGFFGALMEHVTIHEMTPRNFLVGGDQVAVVLGIDLEIKGRRLVDLEIHLWTFDAAGKISRFAHVVDRHAQVAAFRGQDP